MPGAKGSVRSETSRGGRDSLQTPETNAFTVQRVSSQFTGSSEGALSEETLSDPVSVCEADWVVSVAVSLDTAEESSGRSVEASLTKDELSAPPESEGDAFPPQAERDTAKRSKVKHRTILNFITV